MLLVVTLLAFLVVLLVGLAAYSRVETAIAGNTQRQTQARQNALMALDVALGQLQKFAGPDKRVTATADAFGGAAGTKHFTGVWPTDPADDPDGDPKTPLTWLVSGNEYQNALSVLPTTAFSQTDSIELVGAHTSGTARDVIAKLQPVTSVGVPGVIGATNTVIGRYAWWVGDQGVKAPVALGDPTATASNFAYDPYQSSADTLSRIRQQISLGAGAANADGTPAFEPRDSNNAALVANQKVTAYNQLAYLKNSGGTAIGLAPLKTNFHAWSSNNFNVLANTKLGGLRQDLSLFSGSTTNPNPSPLGPAYDAWANYDPANGGYMEDFTNPISPTPLQAYSSDPLRRRYVMQPASSAYGISPVLSYFGLSFSLHNDTTNNSPTKLIASIRGVFELWNPYTAALVPEDLAIVVQGLPTVTVEPVSGSGPTTVVDLQSVFQTAAGTVKFALPFTSDGQNADRSSWLPGRVYDWSAVSQSGDPGSAGYATSFYVRDATPGSGSGVERDAGPPIGPNTIGGAQQQRHCAVSISQTLTIELRRASTNELLATFTSPTFTSFDTDNGTNSINVGDLSSDFAYVFRLPDRQEVPVGENDTWLQSAGRDVREVSFPAANRSGYVVANGKDLNPMNAVTSGTSGFPTSNADLLLNRDTDAASENYNEDAPVFELPRAPLLSIGMLQHLRIAGARPFAIGNSWTNGVQLNGIKVDELFDRFYFSGLAIGVAPIAVNGSLMLPNPLLKVLRNSSTGVATKESDLRAAANGQSAKFLLQGGAFNLNSVNPAAWAAVLRSVRYSATADFKYLDASTATGTADDDSTAPAGFTGAALVRFPQSAQEVYKADDGYQRAGANAPGDMLLFRRGVRQLAATDVTALANAILPLITQYQAANGPFTSLEQFLNPSGGAGNPSLLEQAISNANLNTSVPEFSSQFLTQADIMTALAPVLFPRSDTFVIRTYGEAVNPTTGATEGRAWCEATVQRVPDYYNAGADDATVAPSALADPSNLNQTFGRRFKIVSFRWLTRSDI